MECLKKNGRDEQQSIILQLIPVTVSYLVTLGQLKLKVH